MAALAVDTETKGLDWHNVEHRAFLGTTADATREWVYDFSDPEQIEAFKTQVTRASAVIMHNASFDCHHVREATGLDITKLPVPLHDTDLLSRIVWPAGQRQGERGGHGLKNLAVSYLNADADAAEKRIEELALSMGFKLKSDQAYYKVWQAYPRQLEEYALLDARYTYDLFNLMWDQADDKSKSVYDLERKVQPILVAAEARGVRVEPKVVAELKVTYSDTAQALHTELERELGPDALNGKGSEEALVEALQKLGVPLKRRTPTGRISTNKFALQDHEAQFPILQKLEEYRSANKFLSTYIKPMEGVEVVHPAFRQIGAWTGRMSCTRPNMQNQPVRAGSEVREMFQAREGHKLVVVDYDSIEVRLLAWYLGNQEYRDLITSGYDPHSWMAAQLWGGTPEDYPKGSAERSAAKNSLFAIIYGAGGRRLSDMNNLGSDEKGRALARKIKKSLPGYSLLMKRVRQKIEEKGYVNTIAGRKQVVNPDKSYVGLNALIQGSAADIMKAGLVAAAKVKSVEPLLVVHDEFVGEVPEECAEDALHFVQTAMDNAWDIDPKLATTGCIVDNYGEAK